MAHAKLSPSSAVRWATCPGSVVLSEGLPDRQNMAAARGTVAHDLSAHCLATGEPCFDLGKIFHVGRDGIVYGREPVAGELKVVVDEDMIEAVEQYLAEVRPAMDGADDVRIEQKVSIEKYTGEAGATGTADLIILRGRRLEVRDAKFGFHKIEPEQNWQGMLYGLGALDEYELITDIDEVLIVIHQPEHGGPREWLTTPEELRRFGVRMLKAALEVSNAQHSGAPSHSETWQEQYLTPSNDGCRYCPARATCPVLKAEVDAAVAQEFDDLTDDGLGTSMSMVERVEAWTKAVRAEVERRLLARKAVPGFKLVTGRRGARKWIDEAAVEAFLAKAVGDAAYDKKLISPTTAEKTLKKANPDAWDFVSKEVTQSDGKPSVAPVTDKREEYTPGASADEFEMLIEE
jgi:hypothetical protein